jgi:dienelactone hydrolase
MPTIKIRGLGVFGIAAACCLSLTACSAGGGADASDDGAPESPANQGGDIPELPGAGNASNDAPAPIGNTPRAGGGVDEGTPSPSIELMPSGPTDESEASPGPEMPVTPPALAGALIRGGDPSVESASTPGPFDVDIITTGLRDGPGYGTQTLHVPADAEPPFASVVVVPGFVSPESSIQAWGPFLASHGIVTLTIGTNAPGDLPDVRARALLDGIQTLRAENERSGSPLEGQMALDRFGVMGWSMGGGGTLIAANGNPELRAAVSLAAWSPGVQFSQDQVPTLMLAGSADPLAGGQSQGFFDSIPETTPKMLFEVAGGAHDIANNPRSADGEIGRYGLSWLKVFLEGDERYRQFLLQEPTRSSEFRDNLE